MPQSLTQLPETANIGIGKTYTTIVNHKVTGYHSGIIGQILSVTKCKKCDRYSLAEFEKHGISFEAAIENSVLDLEDDNPDGLASIVYWKYDIRELGGINQEWNHWACRNFAESAAGRIMAEQLVEKIRSCNNWEELYDELHMSSQFQQDIKSRLVREIRIDCIRV